MKKRPEKKIYSEEGHYESKDTYPVAKMYEDRGYNQACDDYEAYLPSVEEIEEIMNNTEVNSGWGKTFGEFVSVFLKDIVIKNIAKTIKEAL